MNFLDPLFLAALVVVITLHEFSHALAAEYLGDPTPRLSGRLTLNPLAHLDPIGTLMLIVARFGWGKPVPFDPYNLQNPRRDAAIISLAGPTMNFATAILLAIGLRIMLQYGVGLNVFFGFFSQVLVLSVMLGLFNLLPVHPLDGGKILVGFLPRDQAGEVEMFLRRYGMFILIFIIITPILSYTLFPLVQIITGLLLPGVGLV
jgi:Zn-dependent protease